MPRQGQGKRDDPRWIFAGPRGEGNLKDLERCLDRGTADEMRGEGRRFYKHMPRREQLRLALANVARGAGRRNALRESGYEV